MPSFQEKNNSVERTSSSQLRFEFADIISVLKQNKEAFAKNSKGFFMIE